MSFGLQLGLSISQRFTITALVDAKSNLINMKVEEGLLEKVKMTKERRKRKGGEKKRQDGGM